MDTEFLFPIDVSYQSAGGPQFSTQIARVASGAELRNQVWNMPLHKYDATIGPSNEHRVDDVKAFFMAMRGRYSSFRWKDWNDYLSDHSKGGPTPELIDVTVASVFTYQLQKIYYPGPSQIIRPIRKPRVQGTIIPPVDYDLRIWVDGVEQTLVTGTPAAGEFSINHTTGSYTFGTNHGNDKNITAVFEFDVKCRFDTDSLEAGKLASAVQQIVTIPVVEVR
jgi:uncharacterized protein (TIGR02217 family)